MHAVPTKNGTQFASLQCSEIAFLVIFFNKIIYFFNLLKFNQNNFLLG